MPAVRPMTIRLKDGLGFTQHSQAQGRFDLRNEGSCRGAFQSDGWCVRKFQACEHPRHLVRMRVANLEAAKPQP